MHDEILTPDALDVGLTQLEGKPIFLMLGGKRRDVGVITAARVTSDRVGLLISASITDEEVAGILGAAQDANQAAASPIGMSAAEIEAVIR